MALVGLCLPFSQSFGELRAAAITLTPYAVTTRYPGDLAEISAAEATEALELARQALNFILAQLPKEI